MSKGKAHPKPEKPRHYIREWRKYRGLSQERLAERIERTHGAISQLERGITTYQQETLEALAYALNCDPADLLRPPPTNDQTALAQFVSRLNETQQKRALQVLRAAIDDSEVA